MVDLLDCAVMPYAWGSCTALAELAGRSSPSAAPEAELWMGAHPSAPSRITRSTSSPARSLGDVIAASPTRELGAEVEGTFGPHLPFLLKVLAAAQPLSLQAHPNEAQATKGFEDEERRGIARDAPTRSYRDSSHKPELLCALVPVEALCGFRQAAGSLRLLDDLAVTELAPLVEPLRSACDARGLAAFFGTLMTLSPDEGARIVRATIAACAARSKAGSTFAREYGWALRLAALYPDDVGVVSALLLNLVLLQPGEALYLGAGNLHAYLEGVGVEIMASSDNVLRGGLTKKHMDVAELMRVLDFADGPADVIRARAVDAHECVWDTPAREFRLSAINVASSETSVVRKVRGPEILLCTKGVVVVAPEDGSPEVVLASGRAAFVPASTGRYAVRTAAGNASGYLYRATVNLT